MEYDNGGNNDKFGYTQPNNVGNYFSYLFNDKTKEINKSW